MIIPWCEKGEWRFVVREAERAAESPKQEGAAAPFVSYHSIKVAVAVLALSYIDCGETSLKLWCLFFIFFLHFIWYIFCGSV